MPLTPGEIIVQFVEDGTVVLWNGNNGVTVLSPSDPAPVGMESVTLFYPNGVIAPVSESSDTQIVFNNNDVFMGDDNLTWDTTNQRLRVRTEQRADGDGTVIFGGDSTALAASSDGLRRSVVQIFDTVEDELNSVALKIDFVQRSGTGQRGRTGIHVFGFTQPDNGGDTSCGLFTQTGGGGALTAYKVNRAMKPVGWEDYASSVQGALEVSTSDDSQAILAGTSFAGFSGTANAIVARVSGANNKGILVQAEDGLTYDARPAYAIGNQGVAQPSDSALRWIVHLSGDQDLLSILDDNTGRALTFHKHRDGAAVEVSDTLGQINWSMVNSALGSEYGAVIRTIVLDPTDGAEEARLEFQTITAGGLTTPLAIEADQVHLLGNGVLTSTSADTLGRDLVFLKSRDAAAAQAGDIIGTVAWSFRNSALTEDYGALLRTIVADATDGSEDSRMELVTMNAGVFYTPLVLESNKIGFFEKAPVARPTGVAVDAAGIHAALVSLGLITA